MKKPGEHLYPDDEIAQPQHNGRGALSNASSRFDDEEEDPHHRRLGHRGRAAAVTHDAYPRTPRAPSSRATPRPTCRSTARSIPIAAASTLAASTALRGRPMLISACRPEARLRDEDPLQAGRRQVADGRELALAQIPARRGGDGHQHQTRTSRSSATLKITRSILRVAGGLQQSCRHRHQESPGDARYRYPGRHGQAQISRRSSCR